MLDEPLSGTDPAQRLHLRDVIRRLGEEGRTILVSSHILEEVDELADRIHLLVSGKLAASGDYRAIRQQLNDRPFYVRIDSTSPRVLAAGLLEIEAVESVEIDPDGHLRVRSRDVPSLQRALARDRAAARRPAHPRRAARRLARERLRVPGEPVAVTRSSRSRCASSREAAGSGSCSRSSRCRCSRACSSTSPTARRRAPSSPTTSPRPLVASGILPLVMLLFGTSAFGNEVGDRTLVYLALKPLPRWRIVAPKLLASLLVGGVPVAVSGLVAVARDPRRATSAARSRPASGCSSARPRTRRSSPGPGSRPGTRSSSASSTCSSGRPRSRRTSTASAS